ncbi:MAG TPA: hypothetical protein VG537_10480 [Candidatus Kapabacteria bacterium]|jgi:hypothetical protein|nr:hypothetical protein [Candidatus Kapabacteria bacterium]
MRIGTTAVTDVQSLEFRIGRYGPFLYSLLLLIGAVLSRFAILSNDSFPLEWQASHLSFHDPLSFYNGFFPIGYPLLLRIAQTIASPYIVLEVVQILLAALYFKKVWTFARIDLLPSAAILVLVIVIFSEQVILAEFSSVPDFFPALFAMLALVELSKDSRGSDRMAGLYLGLGLLFREHLLILLISITLALLFMRGHSGFRRIASIWIWVAPFIVMQGLIQLWSGHGFFENDQAWNLWKTLHGIDWSNPPAQFHPTLLQVVLHEPVLFFQSYVSLFISSWYLILPLVLYSLMVRMRRNKEGGHRTLDLFSIAAIIYLLVTIAGGSARSYLPVLPIIVVSLFQLIQSIAGKKLFSRIRVAFMLSVVLAGAASIVIFTGARHASQRLDEYDSLQHTLGLTSTEESRSIFSDDFALYFPSLADATPRTTGGWGEIGLPEYLRANPHIPDTSANAFYSALKENGIQYAVIRNPPIDARTIWLARADTAHFIPVPFSGPFYVYRVQ